MTSLEGKRFKVTSDELLLALEIEEQDGIQQGEQIEVVEDPAEFDMVDEECVKVVHESNFDIIDSDEVYPAQPVITKSELEAKTEEV